MEPAVLISVGIVALIVLPFILAVLAFRPLINSLADRIGGRKTGAKEIKDLKQKLMLLQDEVADLRGKVMGMEDDYHFAQKMLEDMETRPERKKKNKIVKFDNKPLRPKNMQGIARYVGERRTILLFRLLV